MGGVRKWVGGKPEVQDVKYGPEKRPGSARYSCELE